MLCIDAASVNALMTVVAEWHKIGRFIGEFRIFPQMLDVMHKNCPCQAMFLLAEMAFTMRCLYYAVRQPPPRLAVVEYLGSVLSDQRSDFVRCKHSATTNTKAPDYCPMPLRTIGIFQ